MERFNRFLLNTLYIGIFFSSFAIIAIFHTGSKLTDIYNNQPKEEFVKRKGKPVERQIMGKTDDGEYLQFILWDAKSQSKYKARVTSEDYDLYRVGESFDTDTYTPGYR